MKKATATSKAAGDDSGGGLAKPKPKPETETVKRGKQPPAAAAAAAAATQGQQQRRPPPRSPSKKNRSNGVPNKQSLPRSPSARPSVSAQAPPIRSPHVSPNKKKKKMNNTMGITPSQVAGSGSSPNKDSNKRRPSMPSQHNRPNPPQIYQPQKSRPNITRNDSHSKNNQTSDGIMKMKAPPRPASMIMAPTSPKKTKAGVDNSKKKKNKTTTTTTKKKRMSIQPPQGQRPDPPPGINTSNGYGGKGRTMSMPPPPNPFQEFLVKTKSIVAMGLSSHSSGGSFDRDLSDDDDVFRNSSSRSVSGKGGGGGRGGVRRKSQKQQQQQQSSYDGVYGNNGWDDDYKEYNGDIDGYYEDYEEYDALKGDGGTASNHPGRRQSRLGASSAHSSVPSIAPVPFPDDTRWKKFLRYIRILPPKPNERPEYRKIRIFIWCSLVLDFLCAVVALATFGQVTTCCGTPIWGFGTDSFDFSKAMRVVAVLYLVGIFIEVVPVVRGAVPWNMINPLFGFLISFAVFFDDSRMEAVSMWVLEALAIFFEFLVYRIRRRLFLQKKAELAEVDRKLEPYIMAKRVRKAAEASGSAPPSRGISRGLSRTLSGEFSVSSFYSDSDDAGGYGHHQDHREIKLLRQRKRLREERVTERVHLHYHLTGVVVNTILIFITIMVIIFVARSGGMCVIGGEGPNPFATNQLEKCTACQGVSGKCEVCNIDPHQCYYPYG